MTGYYSLAKLTHKPNHRRWNLHFCLRISKTSDILGHDSKQIKGCCSTGIALFHWSFLGHRICGPHQPKRDPEGSHLKFCYIGLSQRACRPHPRAAKASQGSLENEKGVDDELENPTLTALKAAGDMVLAKGNKDFSAPQVAIRRGGCHIYTLLPLKVSLQQLLL